MVLRGRLLSCVGLLLLFPVHSQAQGRSPLFERALPKTVAGPISFPTPEVTQASGPQARRRDSLLNGTVIGAAIGAVAGMALVYATRDSELDAEQYAYGALVFGGIGAGLGLGVDALLNRGSNVAVGSPRRIAVRTRVSRQTAAVRLTMRW